MQKKYITSTDQNYIDLPLFCVGNNRPASEIENINHELGNSEFKLKVSYPAGARLTFYDRKILLFIEYIYCKRLNFDEINKEFETLNKENTKQYLQDNRIKKEDDLSLSEQQQVKYDTSKELSSKHNVKCRMADINSILPDSVKPLKHKDIKNSLIKLSNTYIHESSSYFVDDSILQIPSIPLLEVTLSRNKNRDIASIHLNPLHFLNLIKKRTVLSDIKLLTAFKSPIAGRLSEFLKKSLFGSKKFQKDKVKYVYSDLCEYLQITPRDRLSNVKQQLSKPFSELVEQHIIVNWTIKKILFNDYEICFYWSYSFYKDYYNNLDDFTKKEIADGLNKIFLNDEYYKDFIADRDYYLETIKDKIPNKKEFRTIRQYYTYFLYLTQYNRPIPAPQQATTEQKELF